MRGLGYFISIVSVLLLGLVAWPGADEPRWHLPVLLTGMAASVGGMLLRWIGSRKQLRELQAVERETGLR
jgi:hypothetical protein